MFQLLVANIQFDQQYDKNPLVNAMVVGLVHHDDVQKGVAAGKIYVAFMLVGIPEKTELVVHRFLQKWSIAGKEENSSAVAIGDPQIGKKLMDACLEVIHSDALVGIQDMGAAGLTSSAK